MQLTNGQKEWIAFGLSYLIFGAWVVTCFRVGLIEPKRKPTPESRPVATMFTIQQQRALGNGSWPRPVER